MCILFHTAICGLGLGLGLGTAGLDYKSAFFVFFSFTVGWLVFYSTFSTNRLYHAMDV